MKKDKNKQVAPKYEGSVRRLAAKNFFNTAFKEFSLYDNVRSIPSIFDGLKPSQRKALYGMVDRGENAGEIQVERVAGNISALTDYHHGTGSMESTIIGMANNYPGTNNMNLFVPGGQFGSRLTKDTAASRYILTYLSPNFRKLFKKADDGILVYNEVDGEKIEPKYYYPILPMMLVNGSQGTGTGHASLIMNYHPLQVRDAVVKVLKGKKLKPGTLVPWFKGFSGTVERNQETGQVVITGSYEIVNSTTIKITEIPIGTYLDQYKEILNKLEDEDLIKGYEDRSNETAFDFTVTVPRTTTALPHDEIMKRFKLISRDTENFTLWSEDGDLRRYASAEDVIEAFTAWRLTVYDKRLEQLRAETVETIRWLSEKLRFILFYLDNVDSFKNQKKDALITLLLKHDFIDYDRLLAMQIWTLTRDKIEELKKLIDEARKEKARLDADTAAAVYERELKELTYEE